MPNPTAILKGFAQAAYVGATALALSGCGGGDGLPCGGTSQLNIDVTYQVNGILVDPTRLVLLNRGEPVVATPRVVGLPSACADAVRWTYAARTVVPPGLSFDTATGVISGTPTSLSVFDVDLKLRIDGYVNQVQRTISFFM